LQLVSWVDLCRKWCACIRHLEMVKMAVDVPLHLLLLEEKTTRKKSIKSLKELK